MRPAVSLPLSRAATSATASAMPSPSASPSASPGMPGLPLRGPSQLPHSSHVAVWWEAKCWLPRGGGPASCPFAVLLSDTSPSPSVTASPSPSPSVPPVHPAQHLSPFVSHCAGAWCKCELCRPGRQCCPTACACTLPSIAAGSCWMAPSAAALFSSSLDLPACPIVARVPCPMFPHWPAPRRACTGAGCSPAMPAPCPAILLPLPAVTPSLHYFFDTPSPSPCMRSIPRCLSPPPTPPPPRSMPSQPCIRIEGPLQAFDSDPVGGSAEPECAVVGW